ncbi:MAG TPA: excinuclease ABC subunit UvrC [Gammaproteobacteria bacterium]|nr:excinuclease ABC subunit UvrC [Gammaproteobacteria bacterium]
MPFDQKKFLASLTKGPGVYVMRDPNGEPMYVGKAGNLKNRVSSYFNKAGQNNKTRLMMASLADIDIQRTRSEIEALLLESNLIKRLRPRFNILLRDDKSYPHLRLSTDKQFPGLSLHRGGTRGKGRFFGPYANTGSVRTILGELQKVIPIRQCHETYFRNRSRPCLQYQIKRCSAPCVGLISVADYQHEVDQVIMLLRGKNREINRLFEKMMEKAAGALDFESAAIFRDRIGALRKMQESQYVSGASQDADVASLLEKEGSVLFSVMQIRSGQNLGSRHFIHKNLLNLGSGQILQNLLVQYYQNQIVPTEVITTPAVEGARVLEALLTGQAKRKVLVKSRVRSHRARWIELATLTATDHLDRHLLAGVDNLGRIEDLSRVLGFADRIERIECFDISHTLGERPVASCVVFDLSGPVPSEYRRFNIRGVSAGDDYEAIGQVVSRRMSKVREGQGKKPDLLVIDGGLGQVNKAYSALQENLLHDITVVGIAKGRSRKSGRERLFLPGKRAPLILPVDAPARLLLQHVRDEAHRFAITGHRKKRSAARIHSRLEDVPGIGSKKRHALLRYFGGMRPIAHATIDELLKVDGINRQLAKRIIEYFQAN